MSHTKHSRSLAPLYINSMSQSRSFNEPQIIGQYRLIKTIGKGNFAKVKLARHLPTDRLVAIKIIDKSRLSTSSLQKLFREVRIMKTLDHPNIVKLYEVIENEKCLFLIMEYASRGEIFDFLVANGRMKEKDVRIKFRQILSAVHYCHQKGIVHRDLKAENLLLDRDLSIKIADFGFSNEFKPGCKLDTFCGSPPYAAPELFQGKKYDGPEVDVWSMGVILYTLISGSLPFDGNNLKELRERVLKGKYRVPFYMSSECENFLKKFLVINPSKRITLENAMKEKWMNNGFDGCGDMEAYKETPVSLDEKRVATMVKMGINRIQIEESLNLLRFDKIYATYHLLGIAASHQTVGCDLPTHLSGPVLQNSHRSSPRWREEQRVVVPSSRQVVIGGTSHVGRQANYILPPPPPLPINATIPSTRHQNNNQFEMASCVVPAKQPPTTATASTIVTTTNAFDLPDAVNGTLPRKISEDGKERASQRVSRSMTYSHRRTHSVNAGHSKGHTTHNNSSPPTSTFNPLSMKSNKMSTLHHQPPSDADKTLSSSPAPPLSVPCNITVINNSFVSTPRNVWTTRNSSRSAPGSRFPRQPPPRQATVPAGGTIGRSSTVEAGDVLTPPPPRGDGKNSSSGGGGGAISFFSKLTSKFRK